MDISNLTERSANYSCQNENVITEIQQNKIFIKNQDHCKK